MRTTEALSFTDRLMLAQESLSMTYEERDSFLSDDDVLDAAEAWTTSLFDDEGGSTTSDDYFALRDALFAATAR